LGLFFFSDGGDAKRSLRIAIADTRQKLPDSVFSGDLFGTKMAGALLTATDSSPDPALLDTDLLRALESGGSLNYVPYVVGVYGLSIDALRHTDKRMRQESVQDYRGLITFLLPEIDLIVLIGKRLGLPVAPIRSDY
jgi:hypothetical protein